MNLPAPLPERARLRLKNQTIDRYWTSWKTSNSAIPTSTFSTDTLEYHQKPKLVAISTSLTGLGWRSFFQRTARLTRKATLTATSPQKVSVRTAATASAEIAGPPVS